MGKTVMKISVTDCGDIYKAIRKAYLAALRNKRNVSFIRNRTWPFTVTFDEARQNLPGMIRSSIDSYNISIKGIIESQREIPRLKKEMSKEKKLLKTVSAVKRSSRKKVRNEGLEDFFREHLRH